MLLIPFSGHSSPVERRSFDLSVSRRNRNSQAGVTTHVPLRLGHIRILLQTLLKLEQAGHLGNKDRSDIACEGFIDVSEIFGMSGDLRHVRIKRYDSDKLVYLHERSVISMSR